MNKRVGDILAPLKSLDQSGGDIDAALKLFEDRRLRVSHAIDSRGSYLGSDMEAQLQFDAEREAAERARIPSQMMMETVAPLDFEAVA